MEDGILFEKSLVIIFYGHDLKENERIYMNSGPVSNKVSVRLDNEPEMSQYL